MFCLVPKSRGAVRCGLYLGGIVRSGPVRCGIYLGGRGNRLVRCGAVRWGVVVRSRVVSLDAVESAPYE